MSRWKQVIRNADWHAAPLMVVMLILAGGGTWLMSAAPISRWPSCADGAIQGQAAQLVRSSQLREAGELRLIASREVQGPYSADDTARRCVLEAEVDGRIMAFRFNIHPQKGSEDMFLLVLRDS